MAFGYRINPLLAAIQRGGTTAKTRFFDDVGGYPASDMDMTGDRPAPDPGENGPIKPGLAGIGPGELLPPDTPAVQAFRHFRNRGDVEAAGPSRWFMASHGGHSGQQGREVDLGDGQFAHVYYDSDGRRRVLKFRR